MPTLNLVRQRFTLRYAFFLLLLISVALHASDCCAELKPEEIALVTARGNQGSTDLARYYCKVRGVPAKHVIEVDLPAGEELERKHWRWSVRPEIREWLAENDPDNKIRCLVTTWGVPLKIAKNKPDDASKAYRKYLEGELANRLERLNQIVSALNDLAGGLPSSDPTVESSSPNPAADQPNSLKELASLKQQIETALKAAQLRVAKLLEDEKQVANGRLQQLAVASGGARVLLQAMNQRLATSTDTAEATQALRQQFNMLRGRTLAFTELNLSLEQRASSYERDSLALTSLEATGGLIASVDWLKKQLTTVRKNETGASFDSELSLVLWDDGYELLRWQPNYLRPAFRNSQLPKTFRTLMVARLDAPTLKLAKGLIDTAIKVEKEGGLKGKVYLDARGLAKLQGPQHSPGSYPDYDRALLITAEGLKSLKDSSGNPRFEVTVDQLPMLFQPGQCPDAALYCGWYSLAKYVDAFEWSPGAVAYHLASGEAATLKEIDSQAWCKKLLEDGVCVTIGPVYEPYLLAFPRPNEFFSLLTQGNLTVVEVYYHTKPFNSWAMILIGDPLYRPFTSKTP